MEAKFEKDVEEGLIWRSVNGRTKHNGARTSRGGIQIDSAVINSEDLTKYNYDESLSGSDSGSEDDERRVKKRHERFKPLIDMEDPKFKASLIFESKYVLSDTVKQHGVKGGRKLNVAKGDPTRLTVVCTGNGFKWRLHAAKVEGNTDW